MCQRLAGDKSGVKGCSGQKSSARKLTGGCSKQQRNARELAGGIVWFQGLQGQQRGVIEWREIKQVPRVAGYIRGVPEGWQEE